MAKITRRQFLTTAGLASGALLVSSRVRARIPWRIEHHRLPVHHPGLQGQVWAQLSDLHVDGDRAAERCMQAIRLVNARRPDLVFLTGDYVTRSVADIEPFARLARHLRAPCYACLGNHDHYADGAAMQAALQRQGVQVLSNASRLLDIGGARLRIIGIDDVWTHHADPKIAYHDVDGREDFRLVLCHVPTGVQILPEPRAHLILSGHTHGGQIAVPGLTRRIVRAIGSPYLAGFYATERGTLYVNRGWGTVGLPIRLGAPAEITFFHLGAPA